MLPPTETAPEQAEMPCGTEVAQSGAPALAVPSPCPRPHPIGQGSPGETAPTANSEKRTTPPPPSNATRQPDEDGSEEEEGVIVEANDRRHRQGLPLWSSTTPERLAIRAALERGVQRWRLVGVLALDGWRTPSITEAALTTRLAHEGRAVTCPDCDGWDTTCPTCTRTDSCTPVPPLDGSPPACGTTGGRRSEPPPEPWPGRHSAVDAAGRHRDLHPMRHPDASRHAAARHHRRRLDRVAARPLVPAPLAAQAHPGQRSDHAVPHGPAGDRLRRRGLR